MTNLARAVAAASLSLCLLAGAACADEPPAWSLPAAVPDRIGRAQVFVHQLQDRSVLATTRDFVWGDDGPKLDGVYGAKYMMVDRDPDRKHDQAWYEANHPDWLVYKADRAEPAHEFKYKWGYNSPVDIANPAVRQYLFDYSIKPIIESGRCSCVGVDNVECINLWSRAGVRADGDWRQLYSGQKVDPAFARDVADWLGWLADRVHAAGLSLAANHYPHLEDEAGYRLVADKLDIILDEHGFTRAGKAFVKGDNWLKYMTLFADLARTKAIVTIDQLAKTRAEITPELRNWSLANHLLMKGDHSYLSWQDQDDYGALVEYAELYLPTGRALEAFAKDGDVYRRRFEEVLALVNPSPTATASYPLEGNWHDLQGDARRGTLALPPLSGLVLIKG